MSNNPSQKSKQAPDAQIPQDEKDVTRGATRRFPIVAIGASAGGLEALQAFFSQMPRDSGLGFIVVTHVAPERESLLPELLANSTSIPIIEARDRTPIKANQIIVARDAMLRVEDGVLHYAKPDDALADRPHHPIDFLFRSLADDQHEYAVGVILSGSGNDGSLGLKDIKAAGGMIMAEDPACAKYTGMPESAQSTGLVDYVLPPEQMPENILQYCDGSYVKLAARQEIPALSGDTIHSILVRLRSVTGQDFTGYKKSTMARRIERRMNVHHIEEPRDYLNYLRENPREVSYLLQELLISVTSFFRDFEAFKSLADHVFQRLLAEREEDRQLRIWVPGCATGEEAYSVAILLDEQMQKADTQHEVQIFATDLDERSIATARAGLYSGAIAVDISPERVKQYFHPEDDAYRINKPIRDMVIFAVQNVISDPPFTRMDLIVCRNLLIYLDPSAQQRVLQSFHYALRPGGLLFMGTSESLGESSDLFEAIDGRNKIFRRRDTPARIHQISFSHSAKPAAPDEEEFPVSALTAERHKRQLTRGIERLLLDRFAPCSIVVDQQNTVLYQHGRSGTYFEPEQGAPRNNLLEMAREGLRTPLAAALRRARKEEREIVQRNVRVKTNGDLTPVDLIIRPLSLALNLQGLTMVTIEPAHVPASHDQSPDEPTEALSLDERQELERELKYTRENLQSTIEELETSNEELKSSNEELQSTNEELNSANEELETSREELQSLNEELNTVNAELQSKVDAFARINDDMNNLLNSMQVATIFLDDQLRVKRYTQQAQDLVRLIDSDIGRPLSDLTSSFDDDTLIEDCRRVLSSLVPVEKELQNDQGQWYMVRLMPYRTAENVIDGVVVTMVDIDRIRRAETSSIFFESIVQTVRQPLLVLDDKLRVVQANQAFYEKFAVQSGQTENQLIYELGSGQWDVPDLRKLLEEILPDKNMMTDFHVQHDFPKIGHRDFLLNARQLCADSEELKMILLAFEDMTEKTS